MAAAAETPRRRRANGEASRRKILDAATEIAAERGYEGTSIALVSQRSGLPASSIYWHFEDKDALIAAVIERSFGDWLRGMAGAASDLEALPVPERVVAMMRHTASVLLASGDFLRLGLMLALERRPEEPSARKMFLRVREEALRRIVDSYGQLFPDLGEREVRQLATLTMAMADGLFVAQEIDPETFALFDDLEPLAAAFLAAAERLVSQTDRSRRKAR